MEYSHLIREVTAINKDAGEWLLDEAPKLQSFAPGMRLSGAFSWDESPQGETYWVEIWKKLPESYK